MYFKRASSLTLTLTLPLKHPSVFHVSLMELIFHSLINVVKKQRKVNYTSSSIVFVMLVTYVTTRTNKKKHSHLSPIIHHIKDGGGR